MDREGDQVGVIGIDFGTTNCCAAIYTTASGSPEVRVLENNEGGRTTASFVFFTEKNKILVGNLAKKMANAKPQYGISEFKRLLGRKFNDPTIRNNIGYYPFDLFNVDDVPTVKIVNPQGEIVKKPEELAAIVLRKIKENVEAKFENNPADKAVITVPAYFSSAQREAVLRSAEKAGFTVLKLLSEPTAAALCYLYHNNVAERQSGAESAAATTGLVFDLGGGTFDVAILRRKGGDVAILAVDGDTHLGGQDLDNLLVDHVLKALKKDHGYEAKGNRRVLRILKSKCEEAKAQLSFMDETTVELDALPNAPEDLISVSITRREFEDLSTELFEKCIAIVPRCLKRAGIGKGDIDVVILSGGSTRIPKIQKMLSDFFDGKVLNKSIPPEECVAEGAAIQAAMLSRNPLQVIDRLKVTDVIPLSLGIGDFVDLMTAVIPRNTSIPVSRSVNRVTIYDRQTSIHFRVYEGERLNVNRNYFLGHLEIGGITPSAPGQCEVKVTMSVDENGILTMRAREVLSGREKELKLTYTRGTKSEDEVSAALRDASENREDDEKFQEFADQKGYVVKYCVQVMHNLEDRKLLTQHKNVYDQCAVILSKVKRLTDSHQTAEALILRREVVGVCADFVSKHNLF